MDGFPKAKKIKQDVEEEEEGESETSHKAGLSTVESSASKERHSSAQSNAKLSVISPERGEGVAPLICDELLAIEQRQCSQLLEIEYPSPVTHVYNPLSYASETHENFVRRYGNSRKKILFVGMNPGPFGMAQNGVPFGDTTVVKEWLGITGSVSSPTNEHPKRTIQGLECTKNEVSGTRFWNLMRELCSSPDIFFKNCYVHNYCPLCFMAASGKNITPPMLRTLERRHMEEICNQSLVEVMSLLGVEFVVGVGKYAEERARAALTAAVEVEKSQGHCKEDGIENFTTVNKTAATSSAKNSTFSTSKNSTECAVQDVQSLQKGQQDISDDPPTLDRPTACGTKTLGGSTLAKDYSTRLETGGLSSVRVHGLMHPSPINPAANKGWNQLAIAKFSELGLLEIIKGSKK